MAASDTMSLERMAWVLVMCLSLVDVCRADNLDDGLITILNGTNGAATFTSYLQGRTDFVNQLNGGNFTRKAKAAGSRPRTCIHY